MQNVVIVSHTVRAHLGGPKIVRTLGPAPRDGWSVADHRETPLFHLHYHTKFGRSKSNRMGVSRVPKSWGRWARPLHYAKFGRSR